MLELWSGSEVERDLSVAVISCLIRQKAVVEGLPCLLLRSSSCGLELPVLVSLSPPDTSKTKKGQSGKGSVQAQSRAWKSDLLNRKIFVRINRFDYMKSKICTWQHHINQTKG